jgi:hypothetical protein
LWQVYFSLFQSSEWHPLYQDKGSKCIMRLSVRISVFLVLLIVTAVPTAANPDLGGSPYAAQTLSRGLNIGTLAPGDDFWYAFSSTELNDPPARTVVLNMVYKPGDHDVAAYVNFQVLTVEQVDRWLQGYADQYTGMGTFTTTDFDQETAERLWSGSVQADETYYVRLFNNSGQTVEYHLTALGQPAVNAAPADNLARSTSNVIPAASRESGLEPGTTSDETEWLLVAAAIQGMSTEDAAAWLTMASQIGWLPPNYAGTGAGTSASAAVQAVYTGQPGYASPERAALIETSESPRAESEAASSTASPALLDLYPNVYPTAPLALHDGANVGKLAPGGEHWYSFIREDRDGDWLEFMPMTLFSTPTNGNRSHHINFQIFTGSQLHVWTRGTPDDMIPMGAGQWVSRDGDPATGERVWAGHVVDGSLYYVRVFNNSDRVIDYYLITNDVINTELGDRVWAANGTYRQTLWQPSGYIRTVPR